MNIQNTTMLNTLKQKQQEILMEVERLESKISYIQQKRQISSLLCKTLSNCSLTLKNLANSSLAPTNISQHLENLANIIQAQQSSASKHLNFNLESAAIPKLIQLLKLQASINSFTENFYQEKLQNGPVPKIELKFLAAKKKADELANSLSLIQVHNKQFTEAIKNNIDQLSVMIEPAIEKTLNFFVVLHQKPSYQQSPEFLTEKTELEKYFRSISNYIRDFSALFEEFCESRKEFETFSEITHNENSIHQLEFEDIEESHQLSYDRFRVSKDFMEDMVIVEEIVKVADVDAENQKVYLRNLMKIMDCLEIESTKWENSQKSVNKGKLNEQIKFLYRLVNDFFQLLKDSISSKNQSIEKLENIREKAVKNKKNRTRLNSSLFNSSLKRSYIFVDPPKREKELNYRYKDEKASVKGIDGSPFNCIEEFSDSPEPNVNSSVRFEKDSLENPEKLSNDLRAAQTQIRFFQETIAELQAKDEKTQELLKTLQFPQGPSLKSQIPKLFSQFSLLKSSTYSDLQYFSEYINEKNLNFKEKIKDFLFEHKKEIDELKDLNESSLYEKEVLKDTFQVEVKKLMNELIEVKKMNKDLKDSLLKLSNKYESQNKMINELFAIANLNNGESVAGFKAVWTGQQKFVSKLQGVFGVKDLDALLTRILDGQELKTSPKLNFSGLQTEIFQAFDKNLLKVSTAFKNYVEKYQFKVEKCKQLIEIFKKVYESDMTGCLQEIESQNTAVQDYSIKVEELERSIIKYKHLERELHCVISTKSLELQESIENFSTLQEFTENCIRVIEEFKNLYSTNEEFKALEPAIEEILALSKEIL